jgi:hypothetical protein
MDLYGGAVASTDSIAQDPSAPEAGKWLTTLLVGDMVTLYQETDGQLCFK